MPRWRSRSSVPRVFQGDNLFFLGHFSVLYDANDQIISMDAAGAGAGIAATFNTPIGGVMFAIELMLPEH